MKTLRHLLPLLPLALLAACSNDQVLPDAPADTPDGAGITTITAYAPGAGQAATRTTLGPQGDDGLYPVLWNDGDAIAVLPIGSGAYTKFATTIEGGGTAAVAEFTIAEGEEMPTSTDGYWAFYPYDICQGAWASAGSTQVYFVFTIPSEQKAVAGSFKPGINPTFAYTTNLEEGLQFVALNTLLKFRLKGDVVSGLKSVTLAGENLGTGVAHCYVRISDGSPYCWSSGTSVDVPSGITLTPEEDETFQAETDYYIVLPTKGGHVLSDGFTLTFTKQDGKAFTKTGGGISSLDSGNILNLGTIDLTDAPFN